MFWDDTCGPALSHNHGVCKGLKGQAMRDPLSWGGGNGLEQQVLRGNDGPGGQSPGGARGQAQGSTAAGPNLGTAASWWGHPRGKDGGAEGLCPALSWASHRRLGKFNIVTTERPSAECGLLEGSSCSQEEC